MLTGIDRFRDLLFDIAEQEQLETIRNIRLRDWLTTVLRAWNIHVDVLREAGVAEMSVVVHDVTSFTSGKELGKIGHDEHNLIRICRKLTVLHTRVKVLKKMKRESYRTSKLAVNTPSSTARCTQHIGPHVV